MNPTSGYRLYQAQRPRTHAEIITDDARLGRQAAAISRGSRGILAAVSAPALTAVRAVATRLTARPASS